MTQTVNSTGLALAQPNILIGGNFTTNPWQRGTTFSPGVNGIYYADRFNYAQITSTGVVDILKTADSPTTAQAGVYSTSCLNVDVTTADTSIAVGEYSLMRYIVEGYDISEAGFGQASAKQVTLSFWHKHTVTGTYCVAFTNSIPDRSYIAEYTQAVTNTWQKSTITLTGDVTGSWLYDTGAGLNIYFANMCGSTFHTTANAWQAGAFFATSNQVNGLSSSSNFFKLALIKLEMGAIATPYPVELQADVLARCQRYYAKTFNFGTKPAEGVSEYGYTNKVAVTAIGTGFPFNDWSFPVTMRSAPTVTTFNPRAGGTALRYTNAASDDSANPTVPNIGNNRAQVIAGSVLSVNNWYIHLTASAEF